MTARPDSAEIASEIQLLHRLAKGSSGKLVLASFGENLTTNSPMRPRTETFEIGAMDAMIERAIALATEEYRNVYAALVTVRPDLAPGRKGGEADIEGVFGLVADFDARSDPDAHKWAERLPVPPAMVVETSSLPQPSFQCRILFRDPIPPNRAKALAQRLQRASGCDHCTSDLSHVWRMAGGLNWPNRLKVEQHGRPPEPQIVRVVQPFDETLLVSAEDLEVALAEISFDQPKSPTKLFNRAELKQINLAELNLPESLQRIIEIGRDARRPKKQDDSRSAWLFQGICEMLRQDVPPETIFSIIMDQRFGISASVRDKGRRAGDYAKRQIERARAEVGDRVLEAFNAEHAVIENFGQRTVVVSFDSKGSLAFRSFEDFKKSYDHRKVMKSRNGKVTSIGEGTAFLENPNRRQYKTVAFLPGQEADEGILNLYRGPSIDPRAGECGQFLKFVFDVICSGNSEITEWLLNYIAHLFQKPWETPEVCIVLRGPQGVGKNVFVESVGEIISDYFIVISNAKHLVGGFNRHLMDKLIVFADEAFYGGDRRHAGILKNLVTQSQMAVEPKGVDVFMAKKFFRLFMASNEDWVVPADVDDRRMLVLDVSDTHAKDHEYFEALRREWEAGGREAFYDLMLKRDISAFNYRKRPETAALVEQKIASLVGAERIVFEMLSSGEAPFPRQQVGANFVVTEFLIEEYARRGFRASARALADELAIFALHSESKRQTVFLRQCRGFWLPDLAICRNNWAAAKKLKVDWGGDDGEWINTVTPESRFECLGGSGA